MQTRSVLRVLGWMALAVGAIVLLQPSRAAEALGLGIALPPAGSADSSAMGYWFQLSLVRLLACGAAALGATLLWCQSHLGSEQLAALARLLGGLAALFAALAVAQQVAIWNSPGGWVLSAALASAAVVLAISGWH